MRSNGIPSGAEIAGNESSGQGPPVYLVQERDPLIATDIVGSLEMLGPCRAIHVERPDEIVPRLDGEDRLSAAFLQMRFDRVIADGLDRYLGRFGAWIILTDGESGTTHAKERGWGVLMRPFTDEMIHDVIRQVDRGR